METPSNNGSGSGSAQRSGGVMPSARRPTHVQEEKKQEVEAKKLGILKLRFSRGEIFVQTMCRWYEDLSKMKKMNLTSYDLKRKAISVSGEIWNRYAYDSLPKDWVTILRTKHGLTLRDEIKRCKKLIKQREEEQRKIENEEIMDTYDDTISRVSSNENGSESNWKELRRSSRPRRSISTSNEGNYSIKTEDVKPKVMPIEERKTKEFVDLTSVPPPQYWINAYIKKDQEHVLKRDLKIYSAPDKNILFYDYEEDPKLQEQSSESTELSSSSTEAPKRNGLVRFAHKNDGFNLKFSIPK